MEKYDAIVVGAGPAGGHCATKLSELGHSVLLIDKYKTGKGPNFSTAGTVIETVKKFNLPKKVIQNYWKSLYIASPTKSVEFNFKKTVGCVLDYNLLKNHLVSSAKKNGCKIMDGVAVKDVFYSDGKISGVVLNNNEKISADVVVDSTGAVNALASKVGLTKTWLKGFAFGIEYFVSNVDVENRNRLDFYLGETFVPHGYGWLFPTSHDSAKVGVGRFYFNASKVNLVPYLKKFVKWNKQTENAKLIDLHGGFLCFKPFLKKYSTDNFLAIGDASGQTNPLGVEGIRHALYSGDFAATVVSQSVISNDFSIEQLKNYDMLWKNYIGSKWTKSTIATLFFYGLINDSIADKFVKYLSHVDGEDVFKTLFYYKFGIKKHLINIMKLKGVVV